MNEKFKKWATGYSGFDGGNPNGEIWLSGIEWGGESPHNIDELYKLFNENVENIEKINGYSNHTMNLQFNYNKRFINIIGAIKDQNFPIDVNEVNNYITILNEKEKFFTKNSNYMKLNLSPFNFPTTSNDFWTSDYKIITGFDTKEEYEKWVWTERKKLFNKMTEKYKPKLIITFGSSQKYYNNFLLFFGFNKNIKESPIQYKSSKRLSLKYSYQNNTLLINLYFPSMGWLVSTESLKETGEIISSLMNKYNIEIK